MSSRISTAFNERTGNITLALGDDKGSAAEVELPPAAAVQIAGRFLYLLGKTLNPDGTTYTAFP